jgi:hypothetical protein
MSAPGLDDCECGRVGDPLAGIDMPSAGDGSWRIADLAGVMRCDLCQRYSCDRAAARALGRLLAELPEELGRYEVRGYSRYLCVHTAEGRVLNWDEGTLVAYWLQQLAKGEEITG